MAKTDQQVAPTRPLYKSLSVASLPQGLGGPMYYRGGRPAGKRPAENHPVKNHFHQVFEYATYTRTHDTYLTSKPK